MLASPDPRCHSSMPPVCKSWSCFLGGLRKALAGLKKALGGLGVSEKLAGPPVAEALGFPAARDHRSCACILLQISPLQAGWAKLEELRRHIDAFNASGKWTMSYMSVVRLPRLLPPYQAAITWTGVQKLGRGATGSGIHVGVAARKASAAAPVRQASYTQCDRHCQADVTKGSLGLVPAEVKAAHTDCGLPQGGEKEYYLASACKELYVAPTAGFTLKGFKVAGAAAQF